MSEPFLGYTNDADRAFPGIKNFRVTVTEDRGGHYVTDPAQRKRVYTKESDTRVHRCANPQCQQGGLDIQRLVLFSGSGSHSISCPGHDGSPKGRRKGDPCDNHFDVTIEIERE